MLVHWIVVAAFPVTRRRIVVVELSTVQSQVASDSPITVVVVVPTCATVPALFLKHAVHEYAAASARVDLTAVTSQETVAALSLAIVKLSSVVTVASVV